MKNLRPLLPALALLLAAGCSNSTTTGPAPDPGGGNQVWRGLTAKVDGVSWSADNVTASKQSGHTTISATGSGSGTIGISFETVTSPRTMAFNNIVLGAYSDGVNSYTTDGNANAGTLTITEVDQTHIAGTFSFTAAETQTLALVRVTSGTFNVVFD